jgi:RNA methyltransferase, TrmH family
VQRLRRLVRQRSFRLSERAFIAEGTKVVEAALLAKAPIEAIYVAPDVEASAAAEGVLEIARRSGIRVYELAPGVMERVADAVSPQPILGVVATLDVDLNRVLELSPLVVLVDVRDPGNVGAIIRSADAAGVGAVICCAGSGDVYNPKAVRSSAGSLFHLPVVVARAATATLSSLGEAGVRRLSTVMSGGEDYSEADLSGHVAIVLGNEAKGLGDELDDLLDGALTIPIEGGAESLNVAMAATVLCFEFARRKRATSLGPTMTK